MGYFLAAVIGSMVSSFHSYADVGSIWGVNTRAQLEVNKQAAPPVSTGVCQGKITERPAPAGVSKFECDSFIYNSEDAAGLFAMRNNAELGSANAKLEDINATLKELVGSNAKLQQLLTTQITTFNAEMRTSIARRFDTLPSELLASEAIRSLKADILTQVDAKIAAGK